MKFKDVEIGTAGKKRMMHGPLTDAELSLLINSGMNVLLIGKHGTGKTTSIRNFCKNNNLKLAIHDTPNLDPFIDLIGVPMPSKDEPGTFDLLKTKGLVDAEVHFFDEINRCDDRVTGSLLQLIQFREIHGTPLPNAKSIFAAMNPNDGDYHVSELDPAFLDRWDQIIYMPAKYDAKVIGAGLGGGETEMRVAKALVDWVKTHVQGYLSPRKLEGIGNAFLKTGHFEITIATVPTDITYPPKELWECLVAARDNKNRSAVEDSLAGDAAAKSSTMGKVIDKQASLKIIAKFKDSIGKADDYSKEFFDYSGIREVRLVDLRDFQSTSGVSPATISKIRSTAMNDNGVYIGSNRTVNAIMAMDKTDPDRVIFDNFMAGVAPSNAGSYGYQWFVDNGYTV